jgi:1,4-dihydroxy-2-naphthoyl-CoA hydrolase
MDIAHDMKKRMPFAGLLGIELKEAGKERVVAELRVREELCTSNSILHGGAVMAFADSLGGLATFLNLPEGAKGTTTIESKTNFLGAAKVGQVVTAECTPIHRGRTTQVWQTRLTGEGGRLVALVTQTQMVLV